MRVSRLYVDVPLNTNARILLPDHTAHYLKNVLRLKSSNSVILFNGEGQLDYSAQIEITGKQVFANIIDSNRTNMESPINTTLIQALGKSDHMDLLVQKSTELGINQLFIFNSQYTQSPLKASRLEKKLAHWKKISISACEQCGRTTLPTILVHHNLLSCIKTLPVKNRILLDFKGKRFNSLVDNLEAMEPFNILIGAEGGFSESEIDIAKSNGFLSCQLGPRVLRMETAGITMLSLIQQHFGDL